MKKLILIMFGTLPLFLFSCKGKAPEKTIRPVKTIRVSTDTFQGKIFPGYAEAEEYSYLTFRIGGMLLDFDIQEGQDLKAGQLVGKLDAHDYNLKLSSAKANYQQAKSQVDRYQRLYEKEAISKQEYEMSQAAYENSQSIYSQALNDVEYTRLVAPFAGNVEKKYVENHQQVMPGEKIIKLSNPAKIQIRFTLPEADAGYAGKNFTYSVEPGIQKGIFYRAKVKEIVSSSVGGSGVPVIIRIEDPAYDAQKIKLLPGYACNVRIDRLGSLQNREITIPIACIYTDPKTNKTYVWKVDKDRSTVRKVPVQTGDFFGETNIIVLSGLENGDTIVTAGVNLLADDEQVKIIGS